MSESKLASYIEKIKKERNTFQEDAAHKEMELLSEKEKVERLEIDNKTFREINTHFLVEICSLEAKIEKLELEVTDLKQTLAEEHNENSVLRKNNTSYIQEIDITRKARGE